MKCPVCKENDIKSKVFIGEATSEVKKPKTYYDEDGKLKREHRGKTTVNYTCSNGHEFTKVWKPGDKDEE